MVQLPNPRTEACVRRRGRRPSGGAVRAWLVAGLILAAPQIVRAQVVSGSYTGDGTDNRAITELGFTPDVVIVKGDSTSVGVIRTSTMAGDASKPMTGATGLTANLIQSLNVGGFTVGTDARVNTLNIEYYWIAFKAVPGKLDVGSYTGNGAGFRAIGGVGFNPETVFVMSAAANKAVGAMADGAGGGMDFDFGTVNGFGSWFTAGGADGFTLGGTLAEVNNNGTTYHYVAWNELEGQMNTGRFTGNGIDNRNITGVGFQPEYVIVRSANAQNGVQKTASMPVANDTLFFDGQASITNRVQALQADGFQVGNDFDVNENGATIYYMAWGRSVAEPQIISGSYTGTGVDGLAITGTGFAPDLVIVKGDNAQTGVFRTSSMTGDASKPATGLTGLTANLIQSLTEDGFTVGTDARVNGSGVQYQWVAFRAGAGEMVVGTHTGNGVDNRSITGVGFQPEYVMVMSSAANEAVQRSSSMAGDITFEFDNGASATNQIQALQADGFQVGTDGRVNTNGTVYHYVAWNEIAGKMDVGSYTGNATDNRSITGVGFLPEYVIVRSMSAVSTVQHSTAMGGSTDYSYRFWAIGGLTNAIQGLEADGFEVGTSTVVNSSATTYHYMAWKRPTLTAVRMASTKAARTEKGVTVTWRTGSEVDNLGFEVYREVAGERTRVTTKPISGSALFVPQGFTTVGRPYSWTDESPKALEKDVTYWVEDIDLNGKRTLHGPIAPAPRKSAEGKAETDPRDAASQPTNGAAPADPVSPETVAVNSPLLEELKLVEPQRRDPAVEPDEATPAATAQATQPTGPIYSGWLGVPVSTDPARTLGSPIQTPAAWQRSQPKPRSGGTAPASRAPVVTTPQVAPASQTAVPPTQPQATPASPATAASPAGAPAASEAPAATARASIVPQAGPPPSTPVNLRIRRPPLSTSIAGSPRPQPTAELLEQWTVASQSAARVMVREAGWYRLTQPVLVAAGINPAVNPKHLRLLVDGKERPLRYVGDENDMAFDPGDALEFFATGVDTPFTDLRAHWITAGVSPGLRVPAVDASGSGTPAGDSFAHTVERKDRSVFFAALQNGDEENFFGPLIMDGSPTDQDLTLPHVSASGTQADLEVALQGVTSLPSENDHRVGVFVNGIEVGEVLFDGRSAAVTSFPLAHALLASGANTVSLEARGGLDDLTLVNYLRLTYQRELRADANQLTLNAEPGHELNVTGFTNASIRVFDVTGDAASQELLGVTVDDGGTWSIHVTVQGSGTRKLLVATSDALATPVSVEAGLASSLHASGQSGEIVMITDAAFASALTPLSSLRQSQGYTVKIVDVQDIYDEFSFGQKTPVAIRDFLVRAADSWTKPPRFVLLVGNATNDPRNYQGFNEPDFVPTRLVPTGVLETASDDWFADADGDSFAELAAIGRLPARTAAEVSTMVDKIVGYEQASQEVWHNSVLLVSDSGLDDLGEGDPNAFTAANDAVGALVPSGYQVGHLKRAEDPTPAATFRTRLSEGAVLVNYQGHGSVDIWRGDVLTAADVPSLDNGSRLPLVVAMTCFSGFFHGLFPEESLAEALLRESGGGAIGVWASSGMTDARWQASMDRELFRQVFRGGWTSVGEAIRAAKKTVGDPDVRRTWIYFGDPALRLKGLSRLPVESSPTVTDAPAPPEPAESESSLEDENGDYRRAGHVATRLADFDGDGRDDVFLAQPETGSWSLTRGEPGSLQHTAGQFAVTGEPLALRLNDDNLADLFVYNAQTGAWLQAMSTGDGQFVTSTGTWHPGLQIVTGDFDGNGRDDLFARYFDSRWFQAFSNGDGYFQERYGLGLGRGNLHAADFNADGLTDIFAYDAPSGVWTMAFSRSGNVPTMTNGAWTPGWQVVVANLNGDNAADVVLWHAPSGTWVQCIRDATQFFVYRTGTWTPGGRLHAADLTNDGRDDLLRYEWRTGEWTLATLDLAGVMTQWEGLWEAGWEVTPGDLGNDALDDLLLYNPDTGEWSRRLNLNTRWTDDASGLWSRNWTVAGGRR